MYPNFFIFEKNTINDKIIPTTLTRFKCGRK